MMKTIFPKIVRAVSAFFLFFSSIGVYTTVTSAGKSIYDAGEYMTWIESVSGNSIAEAYYNYHGMVYQGLGNAIANASGIILVVGIIGAFWLAMPLIVDLFPEKHAPKKCPQCGRTMPYNAIFCTGCGQKFEDK